MGEAVFEHSVSFRGQPLRAGVVLCRTEYGNIHAGVIYHDHEEVSVLHLGWQDYLSDSWDWARLWAVPDVPASRLFTVAAMARLVWRRFQKNRSFPYQLRFAGTHFDQNGQLQFGEGSKGLTCATFVLAIFKSVGVDLIVEETWPIRSDDDRAFLESIRDFASQEHFARLEEEVDQNCIRIRPTEVLGSCKCSLPVTFDDVVVVSRQVEGLLPSVVVSEIEEE